MKISNFVSRRSFLLMSSAAVAYAGLSACSTNGSKGGAATQSAKQDNPESIKEPDEITMVWYPNESATEYDKGREEFGKVLEKGVGRKVKLMTTTDYNVAIEAARTDFHGIYESPKRVDQEPADETQVPILLDKLFD